MKKSNKTTRPANKKQNKQPVRIKSALKAGEQFMSLDEAVRKKII